jgi:outer membrane protein assembly factor BamB
VGQGLQSDGDANHCNSMYMRAFSLIDGKKLMEAGFPSADPFAYRYWQAYDSSPLVDAETDTLIWPGESGVLYTFKLNSSYDPATGSVSMDYNPAAVNYRYTTPANESRETEKGGRWGIEDSAVAWRNYLMFTDNAGILQCVDLNTMSPVYANDMGNDSDVTMVLEEIPVEQRVYLYTGSEYDDDVPNVEPGRGPCHARKIDAMTGKVLWEVPFTADSNDPNVDGGILSAPILGREGTTLEGLVIYNVTKMVEDETIKSKLIALDKETGTLIWEYDMGTENWSPSSPVAVYSDKTDASGRTIAYIVQCDYTSDIALIRVDGATCTEADVLNISEELSTEDPNNIEATPAIFGNTIVIGSRSGHVFFITIG